MITTGDRYDMVIIVTGAGGGTIAQRLAPTGKRILILERGDFLLRERANWSALEVYQKERYHTQEKWYDKDGKTFRPQTGYWVGGNTKVYGAALLRLRERDFDRVVHKGGISPAWDLKYQDFEPYYNQAEKLYDLRAMAGEDPTKPPHSEPYPYPPVSHEPDMQAISDGINGKLGTAIGLVAGAVTGSVSGDKIAEFAEPTIGSQLGANDAPGDLPAHYSWAELQALSKPQT